MNHDEHVTIYRKIAALKIGKLPREVAFRQLTPFLEGLDNIDTYAVLMAAHTMVKPREDNDRTVAHLKAALLALQYGAALD